jgi:transposase
MQTLHRARDRLVCERTSLTNQIRGLLLERGLVAPQGRAKLLDRLGEALNDSSLSLRIRGLLADMLDRWRGLDTRIRDLDAEFTDHTRTDAAARRLTTIPGVGPLNATALVAAVGDAASFAADAISPHGSGSCLARPRPEGVQDRSESRSAQRYLRKMLIQGARAALPSLRRSNTTLGAWLRGLSAALA